MNRSRTALPAATLAVLIAACSDGTPTAEPNQQATPEPTVAATSSQTEASPQGSDVAFPSFGLSGDPELQDRLPTEVGGQPLQTFSMRGDMFLTGGNADPAFQQFLDEIGAEMSDVSVAFGSTASGGDTMVTILAFRVLGAEEDALTREAIGAFEEEGGATGFETRTIGGREVRVATDTSGQVGAVYVWADGDTLFWITTTDEALAEEAIGKID